MFPVHQQGKCMCCHEQYSTGRLKGTNSILQKNIMKPALTHRLALREINQLFAGACLFVLLPSNWDHVVKVQLAIKKGCNDPWFAIQQCLASAPSTPTIKCHPAISLYMM